MLLVRCALLVLVLLTGAGGGAAAQTVSLVQAAFAGPRAPLLDVNRSSFIADSAVQMASLFPGASAAGFFAPYPQRRRQAKGALWPAPLAGPVARILDLIARAEAGPLGYDAVQHGAVVLPGKRPTEMTIAEIMAWIDRTPGQPHAIGRYQFIPATLRRLVARAGIGDAVVFGQEVQDRLATALLVEAGLEAFQSGAMKRTVFMGNLAKIWAGLPTSTGLSHYDGYAGNRATMTWADFDAEMGRIYPG